MATLSGAAVGEAVDPSFIKQVQSWDTAKLQRYSQGGLSDQQTAYVRRQLQLRSAGVQETASQKQIIAAYAEQRGVVGSGTIKIGKSPRQQVIDRERAKYEQQGIQYSQPIGPPTREQYLRETVGGSLQTKAQQAAGFSQAYPSPRVVSKTEVRTAIMEGKVGGAKQGTALIAPSEIAMSSAYVYQSRPTQKAKVEKVAEGRYGGTATYQVLASPETFGFKGGVAGVYSQPDYTFQDIKTGVQKGTTYVGGAVGKQVSNVTYKLTGDYDKYGSNYQRGLKAGKDVGGFVGSFIPTTPIEAGKFGATYAIGAGVGAGVRGTSLFLQKVPDKVLKYSPYLSAKYPQAGTKIAGAFDLGVFSSGLFLTTTYGIGTAYAVKGTPKGQKGEVLGGAVRDIALIGGGFKAGVKGANYIYDIPVRYSRKYTPIEEIGEPYALGTGKPYGKAPTAERYGYLPKKVQLKEFKKTKDLFPELSEGREIGFSAMPSKFYKQNIEVGAGSSELAGIYVGYRAIPTYLKLGSSGSSSIGKAPRFSDFFVSTSDPAIAVFQFEKGFREVPYTNKPITYGDKTFRYQFTKPAKSGYGDIPRMKVEPEALVRYEGNYDWRVTGKKYYTTYEGRAIRLDTARDFNAISNLKSITGTRGTGKKYNPSSYSSRVASPSSRVPITSTSYSAPKFSYKSSPISSSSRGSIISSSKVSGSSFVSSSPSRTSKSSRSSISSFISSGSFSSSPYSSSRSSKSSSSSSSSSSSGGSSIYGSSSSGSSSGGKRTPTPSFLKQRGRTSTKQRGIFGVQVRRFGTFRTIGSGLTQKQAFNLGKSRVGGTLGATFKITGGKITGSGTPKGFYRKGDLFIEKRKYRLSTGGEKAEIKAFKVGKGGVF